MAASSEHSIEKPFDEILKENFVLLTKKLDTSEVVNLLVEKGVLSWRNSSEIKASSIEEDKAEKLVTILVRKNERCFEIFLRCLRETNQGFLADVLEPPKIKELEVSPSRASQSQQIPDDLKCPQCKLLFRNPKMLPCFHTLCSDCIGQDDHGEHLARLTCPVCHRPFTDGKQVVDFPKNYLTKTKVKAFLISTEPCIARLVCGSCKTPDKFATLYCLECAQFLCNICRDNHRQLKTTRSHEFLIMGEFDYKSALEKLKSSQEFCSQHPENVASKFCWNCRQFVCCRCASEHEGHHLDYTDEAFAVAQKEISETIAKISQELDENESRMKSLRMKDFSEPSKPVRSSIENHANKLLEIIDTSEQKLLDQLNSSSDKRREHFESFIKRQSEEIARVEAKYEYLQHVQRCSSLTIVRNWKQIREALCNSSPGHCEVLDKVDGVKFIPGVESTKLLRGEIKLGALDVKSKFSKDNNTISLTTTLMKERPGNVTVAGLTVIGNYLYVARHQKNSLEKYDVRLEDLDKPSFVEVDGLVSPYFMDSSSHNKCIYITDGEKKCLFKVQTEENVSSKHWPVSDIPYGVTVSTDNTVVVTFYRYITEYSLDCDQLRTISLPEVIVNPWSTVKLSDNSWMISSGYDLDEKVNISLLNRSGEVVKSLECQPATHDRKFSGLSQIFRFGDHHVFTVDCFNDKILVFSNSLDCYEALSEKPSVPLRGCLDLARAQLYIGTFKGHIIKYQIS